MKNYELAKKLWVKLGDVPIDKNDCIAVEFETPDHTFDRGTMREEIWHWFEFTFDLSVSDTGNFILEG